ncbi:uncharacterized protein BJ171DRAFT_488391 [Polychytrium aggregatum]|uniref:uncharacterized protein n=1 Tax=Polychytrium aggregatum TaxID=110093 RepID=UPI0022FEF4B5|nr:uncharacterized protein BJ171DRAFT_488391 [Polychytrium aggregatum]KAI9209075.1 hypothetical protein BJ171DRAFT_488391 [Polychytrium aggregatum]
MSQILSKRVRGVILGIWLWWVDELVGELVGRVVGGLVEDLRKLGPSRAIDEYTNSDNHSQGSDGASCDGGDR